MRAIALTLLAIVASTASVSTNVSCTLIPDCVRQLRRTMSDTSRFWFGDEWRFNCVYDGGAVGGGGGMSARQRANDLTRSARCLNPRDLQAFHSMGARLFRVHTFAESLLDNLKFVPSVVYTPQFGSYRACDHDFSVYKDRITWPVGFDLLPIVAFQTRVAPTIILPSVDETRNWSSNNATASYIVLIVDVGIGTLKYLAVDFPRVPRVLHAYDELDNFRLGQPTPYVVLIFEQPAHAITLAEALVDTNAANDAPFDLGQFMLDNELDDALVGLNWFLVEADAYSIERHRLRGTIDNCHALIQQKLIGDRRWPFVEFFGLSEMDASLSVRVIGPKTKLSVCCQFRFVSEATMFADPLGDEEIPSSALRYAPTVTSLRSLSATSAAGDNYQRAQRHYIVLKEERYTLVAFEPTQRRLFWLVVDIPAEALPLGEAIVFDGQLVAPYLPPVPERPGTCNFVVFALFRQPTGVALVDFYNNDHVLRSRFCVGACYHREDFAVEQFKSFHRLRLSALSWLRVCYDAFEAERQIQHIYASITALNSSSDVVSSVKTQLRLRKPSIDGVTTWMPHDIERSKARLRDKARHICAKVFGDTYASKCRSSAMSMVGPSALASVLIVILQNFMLWCNYRLTL